MSDELNIIEITGATFFSGTTDPRPYSLSGFTTYEGVVIHDGVTVTGDWTSGKKWNPSQGKGDAAAIVIGGKYNKSFSQSSGSQNVIYDDVSVSGSTSHALQSTGKIFIVGGTYSSCRVIGATPTINFGGAAVRPRKDDLFITTKTKVIDGETVKVGTVFDGNSTNYGFGGAIHGFSSAGGIYIDGATFSNNQSLYTLGSDSYDTRGGGAIGVGYTPYTLVQNAIFDSNSALCGGGAIIVAASKELDVFNTEFKNNSAFTGGAIKMDGAVLNIKDSTFLQNSTTGETIEGNLLEQLGGAVYNAATATVSDSIFSGNVSGKHGGALYSTGKLTLTGSTFINNYCHSQGGAVYIDAKNSKVQNCLFYGNTAYDDRSGAVYFARALTITGSTFTGNVAHNKNAGALRIVANATVSDCKFYGNQAKGLYGDGTSNFGVGGALCVDKGVVVTVSNTDFSGNSAKKLGGAIYIDEDAAAATVNLTDVRFLTASDTIYAAAGTLSFAGNITLNANLSGDGTFTVADGANFTIGKGVDLNGVDFSNASITVDGADYLTDTLIATGVGGAGTLKAVNNKFMTLTLDGTELWLKEIAGETITETSHIGDGLNIMDNGKVGTFFATKGEEKEIATKISGGKVESNLVGGAYVAAGNTAAVDNVELLIGGTAEVAAKVYAGGYLYGNGSTSADAQLKVTAVNINIDGGAVSTNMYGGAHARQNGNAKVDTVNITVTDGSHSRIYAGGWAEKGAVSSVGTSTVIISGGTVDYLYGAGANADGTTTVGATTITIENDAVVNTIFMGGRYGYSWVNNVSLTFDGKAKVLKRLSGVSSAGMDYAKATVVELATDVTANLIDYVDKFVINEGCTLTANNEFYLGNRIEGGAEPGVTTFDFIAEGEASWTAVAGIDDFTNAKFAVNGAGLTTWDGSAAIEIGGYELTYDAKDKTIKLAQITA